MEWRKIAKGEGVARLCAAALLVATAFTVGFDRQTELVFGFVKKTATYKDVRVLKYWIVVDCVVAAYSLIQLARFWRLSFLKMKSKRCYVTLAWVTFLLDQVAAYIVLGAAIASAEVGVLALKGENGFQWMKLCDRYTHFCIQYGGALLTAVVAFLLLAFISSVSAFNLFSLYSTTHFLLLKSSCKPS